MTGGFQEMSYRSHGIAHGLALCSISSQPLMPTGPTAGCHCASGPTNQGAALVPSTISPAPQSHPYKHTS